jgi:hypothetical protein
MTSLTRGTYNGERRRPKMYLWPRETRRDIIQGLYNGIIYLSKSAPEKYGILEANT